MKYKIERLGTISYIFQSRLFNVVVKLLLGLAILATIYYQVTQRANAGLSWAEFISNWSWSRAPYFLIAVLLIPVNWSIESEKWHGLMNKFLKLSRWESLKSIISGITLGIATPSRIGEYGGRMLFVPAKYNAKVVMSTFVGSYAQNMVNFTLGFIGLLFFISAFQPDQLLWSWALMMVVVSSLTILYFLYFNLDFLSYLRKKINIKWLNKNWIKDIVSFNLLDRQDLLRVWVLSLVRYFIYLTQYALVAYFFGIPLHGALALAAIATIFLIQGSIPLPPFLGVLARGEIALIIWGYLGANNMSILAATYTLWLINVVLPAIIGYILVLDVNISEPLGFKSKLSNTDIF